MVHDINSTNEIIKTVLSDILKHKPSVYLHRYCKEIDRCVKLSVDRAVGSIQLVKEIEKLRSTK